MKYVGLVANTFVRWCVHCAVGMIGIIAFFAAWMMVEIGPATLFLDYGWYLSILLVCPILCYPMLVTIMYKLGFLK